MAQVHVVGDDDEVVELANDFNFGLSGAIFTADINKGRGIGIADRDRFGLDQQPVDIVPRASVRRSLAVRLRPRAVRTRN